MKFSLLELLLVITVICACLAVPSAYVTGRYAGAKLMFDEIGVNHLYSYDHVGVPLYENGKPCAVFWIEQDVPNGGTRHITVRKPGCGGHWQWNTKELLELRDWRKGIAFASDGDYLEDLLD